jgi:hypothetical protein
MHHVHSLPYFFPFTLFIFSLCHIFFNSFLFMHDGWKHIDGQLGQNKCIILKINLIFFGGRFSFLSLFSILGSTNKMDFSHKIFDIIHVTFQRIIFFQAYYYYYTISLVWMKTFIHMFFVKSYDWNFSYGMELVKSTYI